MTGSEIQTVASRLNGVGVWVGDGMGVVVGDGIRVDDGKFVGGMCVGTSVATCSSPMAGWQDVTTTPRLRIRIFTKGKRTGTSLNADNQILSSQTYFGTRKNIRIYTLCFEFEHASEVY